MKYDPKRLFGYPVLLDELSDSLDYPNKNISPKIELTLSPEDISKYRINYDLSLNSDTLNKLINEKKAIFVIRVSCNAALFIDSQVCDMRGSFDILGDNLRDKIEISVFIVAVNNFTLKDINNEFHSDFDNADFSISKGMVLAYPKPLRYFISKENFLDITSIFKWKPKPNQANGIFDVGISEQKIEIIALESQTKIFKNWMRREDSKSIAINSIFLAALTHAIEMLKREPEDYDDNRWANVIITKCENKNIDFKGKTALEIAQRLLNSPIKLLNSDMAHHGE